ncbi:type IX secretion system protein PorQ [Mangrovimonas sp. AS39]|uniref:type IX secretion system protein PorQ n=1 Tax=Mangrovimonas TaxID=1211036 RepID=UPI0006B66A45|nr:MULTISPECIES: type IX secretion system protein PorQ [Mangrovimonas]MCF1192803.1 type IX secretion system protein PorQ [Mangrovimonas futianensis]MCF1196595.1 type IX secretion system protein PorQ [Mangrovimonas futianensis]MCF1422999.1 type IX secretion system protein PorQ [Mangrovimonas futianensis]NIK93365.1 type IX secretion system protein PorQ [Mangrovimonas sp. CR14]
MKKNYPVLLFFLTSLVGWSQIGGESTYQFLNLISSPRQAALGGKTITNIDYDVTQAIYNPATINVEMDGQLAVNYSNYLGGINYGTAAYAYTVDRRTQTFHIGVNYINYGSFDGYDELGNATGSFTGNEAAVSFGYAKQLGWSDFYLGGSIKLITSKLEQYNSFGAAVDAGLIYLDEDIEFQAALVVRNFGTQITTYAGQRESLPFEVALGLSQTLEHIPLRWHITFENLQKWPISVSNPSRAETDLEGNQTQEEVGFFTNVLRHTILGAEFFPKGGFNIRIGYNFRRGEELRIVDERNFSGISAGFGVKLNKFRFSYTHARYTSASNANFFGLQIDLR